MPETETEFPSEISHGSDRMRRFFSLFGIRSAKDERERADEE